MQQKSLLGLGNIHSFKMNVMHFPNIYVIKMMRWNYTTLVGKFLYEVQSEEHICQFNVTCIEFRVSECVQVLCETLYSAVEEIVTQQTSRSGQSIPKVV